MPITENTTSATYVDSEGSTFMPTDSNGNLIRPANITFTVEVPTISTESNSLVANVKATNYTRNRIQVEYAPMSKKDAHLLMGIFEKYKGASKYFYFPIPTSAFNTIANIQNSNGRTMLEMPVFETYNRSTGATTGNAGDDVFVLCDALTASFPSNLLVKFDNHDKVYKTISPATREADGRVAFHISPPLETSIHQAAIVAREAFDNYLGTYTAMRVRIEEDYFEYGTNGAGLVVLKFKLVEDR